MKDLFYSKYNAEDLANMLFKMMKARSNKQPNEIWSEVSALQKRGRATLVAAIEDLQDVSKKQQYQKSY